MQPDCQVCNRFMQSHRVKMTFFPVWKQSLHILQCTGDLRLAMPLHHRYIDQKIETFCLPADLKFHPSALRQFSGICLHIFKRNLVHFAQLLISTDFHGFSRLIPYPGTFQHDDILKSRFLQIFDDSSHNFRMSCCPQESLRRSHQVRLDTNLFVPRSDLCFQSGSIQDLSCHLFILCSMNQQ